MLRLLKLAGLALFVLVVVVLVRTFTFSSHQPDVAYEAAPPLTQPSIEHLQRAIQFQTISFAADVEPDTAQFNGFHRFLLATYPRVHQSLELKKIAGQSLLYKWSGSDPSLKPFVLMAHQDVVPIEEASKSLWTIDPFEGLVKNDTIWGRGACDDKINLIGILEAVEKLLNEDFQPKRTIYLAFGHDEEIGGRGARAIAAELKQNGVSAELVIDEGGIVTKKQIPGIDKPVALIGTAEKGYLSLELQVELKGGHSSMPAAETAMDVLDQALVAIRKDPFPAHLTPVTNAFLDHVGPEMSFVSKMAIANRWLLSSLVVSNYEKTPGPNAFVRTTIVPTIYHAGIKDNVVPTIASAVVNLRLLPGDSSSFAIERVRKTINDSRVTIKPLGDFVSEPTPITPIEGQAFKLVQRTARKTFPETLTAPFLMIGGTDSRYMDIISNQVIKFSPMTDPVGFHGIDERVSLNSYRDTIWFFESLIRGGQ